MAHNGSLIPVPGRDIEVQAWYQGGISVMDFTDAAHPYEIAYFDRGPIDAKTLILGGEWSAYWYNGYIYGSEIARGLDVFKLVPSKFLTQNEIDAADLVQLNEFNVQNQPKITWPSQLVVARAYLDQLERSQALPAKRIDALIKRSHVRRSRSWARRMWQGFRAWQLLWRRMHPAPRTLRMPSGCMHWHRYCKVQWPDREIESAETAELQTCPN